MTWLLLTAVVLSCGVNIYLLWRLQAQDVEAAFDRGQARDERKEMLDAIKEMADRIQHPERNIVTPGKIEEHEPPKDYSEMAFVGQEVPTGYQVGTPNEEPAS